MASAMRCVRCLCRCAWLLGALLVASGAGCNVILDNQPGLLDDDVAARTGEAADASAEDRGRSSQGDEAAASPVVGTGPDAATSGETDAAGGETDSGVCGSGTKACGEQCVLVTEPLFGCEGAACSPCVLPNAVPACVAGVGCAVATCTPGFADCNAVAADGCEADLASPATCGGCGVACPVLDHVTMSCTSGTCTGVCEAGFADCNGDPEDGCERNLLEDRRHCGACDNRCRIGRCQQGACVWP